MAFIISIVLFPVCQEDVCSRIGQRDKKALSVVKVLTRMITSAETVDVTIARHLLAFLSDGVVTDAEGDDIDAAVHIGTLDKV